MVDTFLVGVDGSPGARRALDFGLEKARSQKAGLLLVHVLEWSPYSFLTAEELAERHKRRTEELARAESALIDPLLAELGEAGVPIRTELRYGHIADTLCRVAEEEGVSQIFIGRHGHSQLASWLFGSVAGSMAQAAPVPLTIVP